MNTKAIWKILESYGYPAKSGLDYINEFTFLVAILLSAQAQDAFINTQTPDFWRIAPDAERMHDLGVDEIARYIQRIGLWRNKAQNIYKLSKQVMEFKQIRDKQAWYDNLCQEYDCLLDDDTKLYGPIISDEGIPGFRLGLLQLAGIGRKSANVFLNVVYKAPVFPVDTHVQRVGTRIGLVEGRNPLQIEQMMSETVPAEYAAVACHWLVWHGRRVCMAKKPQCERCLLKNCCNYVKKW